MNPAREHWENIRDYVNYRSFGTWEAVKLTPTSGEPKAFLRIPFNPESIHNDYVRGEIMKGSRAIPTDSHFQTLLYYHSDIPISGLFPPVEMKNKPPIYVQKHDGHYYAYLSMDDLLPFMPSDIPGEIASLKAEDLALLHEFTGLPTDKAKYIPNYAFNDGIKRQAWSIPLANAEAAHRYFAFYRWCNIYSDIHVDGDCLIIPVKPESSTQIMLDNRRNGYQEVFFEMLGDALGGYWDFILPPPEAAPYSPGCVILRCGEDDLKRINAYFGEAFEQSLVIGYAYEGSDPDIVIDVFALLTNRVKHLVHGITGHDSEAVITNGRCLLRISVPEGQEVETLAQVRDCFTLWFHVDSTEYFSRMPALPITSEAGAVVIDATNTCHLTLHNALEDFHIIGLRSLNVITRRLTYQKHLSLKNVFHLESPPSVFRLFSDGQHRTHEIVLEEITREDRPHVLEALQAFEAMTGISLHYSVPLDSDDPIRVDYRAAMRHCASLADYAGYVRDHRHAPETGWHPKADHSSPPYRI